MAAALAAAAEPGRRAAESPSHGAVPPGSSAAGPLLWPALGAVAMLALTAVAFFAGRWGLPAWVLGVAIALLAAGGVMLVLTAQAERRRRDGVALRGAARMFTWRNAALGGIGAVLAWAMVATIASARRTTATAAADAAAAVEGTHVAVLPFQNQGDSADNYIVDGITDEIRGKLARVRGLAVIASGSSAQYRGTTAPMTQVADELGAEYLLLGRVRWAGGGEGRRVQVVSELVDGTTGATTWQQTFEAPLTDVFEVQAQIASRVAGALGTQIGAQDTRTLTRRPTISPDAWDAYLKGKAVIGIDPASLRRATGFYEQAVALDSAFVEAWGGLSLASSRLFNNGDRDPSTATRAREAFLRATTLGPDNAIGHAAAALYHSTVRNDPAEASRSLAMALQLSPNDPDVLVAAGRADVGAGRFESGVARLERARELDPRSVIVLTDLQRAYLASSRFQEAIEAGDAAIAASPSDPGVHEFTIMAHVARGDLASARSGVQRALASGVSPPVLAAYFSGYFEMGWILDPPTRALIPRLSPAAFDDDRAWWGQSLASEHWTAGRPGLARAYADSALAPSQQMVNNSPDDAAPLALYALMLAYAGQKENAVALGRRALTLDESGSFLKQYNRLQLVRIYLAVGEPDQAITELERLLDDPGYVTRAWMQADPLFDRLRGNPRFDRIIGAGS
jgi:TolB-like protein/tetratricopeptide (TPR) repeat protein